MLSHALCKHSSWNQNHNRYNFVHILVFICIFSPNKDVLVSRGDVQQLVDGTDRQTDRQRTFLQLCVRNILMFESAQKIHTVEVDISLHAVMENVAHKHREWWLACVQDY